MTRFVCVTGMHRSGTSMVSRVVDLLGVTVGPDDSLLPAKPDNEAGFWENRDITQLNDDLLAQLGGSWSDPPALEDGWHEEPMLAAFYEKAAELLTATFGDVSRASFKDPRASLLMPFWRRVAEIESSLVVIRHPGDVWASLARREPIEEEHAAQMWLRYVLDARAEGPYPLIVDYERILADPQTQVSAIANHLGVDDSSLIERAVGSIDRTLAHHTDNVKESGGPWSELAAGVYEAIRLGSAEPSAAAARLAVRSQAVIKGARARAADLEQQRDRAVGRMQELDDEVRQHLDDLAAHQQQAQELSERFEAERERSEAERERLEAERRHHETERTALVTRLERKDRTIDIVESELRHIGMQLRGESYYSGRLELVEDEEAS